MWRGAGKRGREGRAGAQGGQSGSGCRCDAVSVAGGKCDDPGNDLGHSDPGIRTMCIPKTPAKTLKNNCFEICNILMVRCELATSDIDQSYMLP